MPNYKNGKIYRLVCNKTGEQYIGSTTQTLARRLGGHKRDSLNPNKKCRSFQIIGRGNYEIVLIEDCPCDTKEQLFRRERFFIETMDCVNKKIPLRTVKEYREANRDTISKLNKEYYEANRDTILEKTKQYYDANRDRKLEQQKQYREANRDTILEQTKQYYEANRDTILEQQKQHYVANRDTILEYKKQYQKRRYEEDPDEFRRQRRDYYHANKEQISIQRKEYRERLKQQAIEASLLPPVSTV
jgi:hypothetical protein